MPFVINVFLFSNIDNTWLQILSKGPPLAKPNNGAEYVYRLVQCIVWSVTDCRVAFVVFSNTCFREINLSTFVKNACLKRKRQMFVVCVRTFKNLGKQFVYR